MKRNAERACKHCGGLFHPYRQALRYCSNACSQLARYKSHSRPAKCAHCGCDFISRHKDNGKSKHWTKCCSRSCAGRVLSKGGPKASRLRRRYGIEPADYARMLSEQNGACALCGLVPHYDLYVDHDHNTGAVRSLLCARCNNAAGIFDSLTPEKIQALWNYTHRS